MHKYKAGSLRKFAAARETVSASIFQASLVERPLLVDTGTHGRLEADMWVAACLDIDKTHELSIWIRRF